MTKEEHFTARNDYPSYLHHHSVDQLHEKIIDQSGTNGFFPVKFAFTSPFDLSQTSVQPYFFTKTEVR